MTIASVIGLLAALFVALPVLAHLLRRRRTETRDFAGAHLVPQAQPIARQRARLEDRSLFFVRAAAVLLLALLGTTPFFRCSRLSLGRKGGGSLAVLLVIDDSLSMRAVKGKESRFARSMRGAAEVLSSLREGDAVAIVAAGAPARVLLAATTDLGAVREALSQLRESDRATDLDTALALAASLSRSLPQPDRRVVLLSDLADGAGRRGPVGERYELPIWVPYPELSEAVPDCAAQRAQRRGSKVTVRVVCSDEHAAATRDVRLTSPSGEVAKVRLAARATQEVELPVGDGEAGPLTARLSPGDAIEADDAATVVPVSRVLEVAVHSDLTLAGVATGGPSPAEQALTALDERLVVKPLPSVPDDAEALSQIGMLVLDDPPGLSPEARTALRTWVERGGVGLLLLGPRAGAAVLGTAAFDPFVPGVVRWVDRAPKGADVAGALSLGAAAEGIADLGAKGRALVEPRAHEGASVLARWADAEPLFFSRPLGRGQAWVSTLPGSLESSDLPVRTAFLEVLSRGVDAARGRLEGQRGEVGRAWVFPAGNIREIRGPAGVEQPRRGGDALSFTPTRAGVYLIDHGDSTETRVAEIDEAEIDLTPRPLAQAESALSAGSSTALIDASPYVAMVVVLAIALEAALRLRARA